MPGSLSAVWFTLLLFSGAADLAQQQRYADAARSIEAGMTVADVEALLGPPTQTYNASGFFSLIFLYDCQPKHYCYGASVHLNNIVLPGLPFANPLPVQLRSFGYTDTDVVIRLSATNKVMSTTVPDLSDVPEEFASILDARDFISTLWSLAAMAAMADGG
jgi:hypothetical protein